MMRHCTCFTRNIDHCAITVPVSNSSESCTFPELSITVILTCAFVLLNLLKQSVENCVCILHNLTFQLEAEAPALFSRMTALAKPVSRSHSQSDSGPIGCFSPQSKGPEQKVG